MDHELPPRRHHVAATSPPPRPRCVPADRSTSDARAHPRPHAKTQERTTTARGRSSRRRSPPPASSLRSDRAPQGGATPVGSRCGVPGAAPLLPVLGWSVLFTRSSSPACGSSFFALFAPSRPLRESATEDSRCLPRVPAVQGAVVGMDRAGGCSRPRGPSLQRRSEPPGHGRAPARPQPRLHAKAATEDSRCLPRVQAGQDAVAGMDRADGCSRPRGPSLQRRSGRDRAAAAAEVGGRVPGPSLRPRRTARPDRAPSRRLEGRRGRAPEMQGGGRPAGGATREDRAAARRRLRTALGEFSAK